LQCNSDDKDDKEVPNPEDMDVGDGARSYLQTLKLDLDKATGPVPTPLRIHIEPLSEASNVVIDLLSNAAGKAALHDAVIG
jgi:hypothetical protein